MTMAPRPATCSDGFLLGLESLMRRRGQGRHLAATVLECAGAPDLAAIRRAADRLGRRHPLLRARIVRSKRDWLARWHADGLAAAPVPLECWRLPGLAGDSREIPSLDALVDRCLNGGDIDILAPGPNLNFHVLLLAPDRWAFVLVWSHSLHDAPGIDKLLREIASPDGDAAADLAEPAHAGSLAALYQQARPMIGEMRTFPAWRIRSLHRKEVRPGASRFRIVKFDRAATAAIRAKTGATAGELLLLPYFACCAARAARAVIAARHPDEEVPVLLSLPVQRQGDPARRPLFQNHMTVYTLLLRGEELSGLGSGTRAVYRKYADFMRRKLPGAMDALMRLMLRCPSRFYNLPAFLHLKGELCTLFHSHTGTFAEGLDRWFGSPLLNGYHIPSVCSPPGLGIFFSEHDDQLTLTLSWKDGCLSPDELALLDASLAEDLGTALP